MATKAERDAIARQEMNLRSVQRGDGHVEAILDTSNYCTIYHFDEAGGTWVKQKQEGPLFVVKRNAAPEYALYMLNRMALKNVTVPLPPGEIKMELLPDGMLYLSRRGIKPKSGVWFADGRTSSERFYDNIKRIVGEPVPLNAAAAASTLTAQAGPSQNQPTMADPVESDLDRLLASAVRTQSPAVAAQPHASAPLVHSPSPAPAAPYSLGPVTAAPTPTMFAPGQTAADLFASINGMGRVPP